MVVVGAVVEWFRFLPRPAGNTTSVARARNSRVEINWKGEKERNDKSVRLKIAPRQVSMAS